MCLQHGGLQMPGINSLKGFGLWLPGLAFVSIYGLSEGLVHIFHLPEHVDVVIDVIALGAILLAVYFGATSFATVAKRKEQEEVHRRQEMLAVLERRFHLLNETCSDGVLLLSADGICRYASPSTRRLLGYDPEALSGRGGFEFVHPDEREMAAARFSEALQHPGQPIRAEFRVRHQEGSWRRIAATMRNLLAEPSVQAIVGTFQDITDNRRAEEELRSSRQQFQASAARLLSAEEEERSRIARELHEELAQVLAALKLDSARVTSRLLPDQAPLREATQVMSELADAAIHSVRRIVADLRPGVLDLSGLAVALEWQAKEFQRSTGIVCEFAPSQADLPLAAEVRTTVFRICQEALSNVTRHAQATRVRMELCEAGGNLLLTVADNGRGITEQESASRTSLGLLAMRDRALLLGGRLSIVGRPGEGTTITVQIPLRQAISGKSSEDQP